MTEREIQAAKLSTSRDLAADLAEIDKHEPVWRISLLWEGRTEYAYKEYEAWKNRLPLVAASAIRRAMAAEAELEGKGSGIVTGWVREAVRSAAEVDKLKADNAVLRAALRQVIDPDANPPPDAGLGKLYFSPTRLMELAWGSDA